MLKTFTTKPDAFDPVSFIIEYESGSLDESDTVSGFQHLIDRGIIGHLQGSYQRMAQALIDAGHCTPRG